MLPERSNTVNLTKGSRPTDKWRQKIQAGIAAANLLSKVRIARDDHIGQYKSISPENRGGVAYV